MLMLLLLLLLKLLLMVVLLYEHRAHLNYLKQLYKMYLKDEGQECATTIL